MVWLIVLAVLCLLPFLPLGIYAVYRAEDPGVWFLVGPIKFRVYPSKKEGKPKKSKQHPKLKLREKGGSFRDFFPVARAILAFLNQLRKKIRVRNLELKVTLAGDDPCDLAMNYGKAWAAVGTLEPQLDRFLVIKRRKIDVACDFDAEKTRVYAKVKATITLGRALHLLFKYGKNIIKELTELKNYKKGGAQV